MSERIERFVHSVTRKAVDRIPTNYYATDEFSAALCQYCETRLSAAGDEKTRSTATGLTREDVVYNVFCCDRMRMGEKNEIRYVGPESKRCEDGSVETLWGTRQRKVDYGGGEYTETVYHPLAGITDISKIGAYQWPSPDWWAYSDVVKLCEQYPDYPLTLGYAAIGWFSWEMFGMERFLENCIPEARAVEAVIEQVTDYCLEYYRRLISAGKDYIGKNFNMIHIADDLATQTSLVMGEGMIRRFFEKPYRKLVDLAHKYGLLVEFHCCGSQRPIIPFFIDIGVDLLNPMQTSAAGMAPRELQQIYGGDIAFSGGMDVQQLLPFATRDQVKDQVKYLLDTFKTGYVFEPAHNIQVGTPVENVIAMYQAYHEYYGIPNDRLMSL